MYGYLAEFVLFAHLAYVAYVVVGQLVIIGAGAFRCEWGRNPWFRWTHLLAIAIVAYEAVYNIRCPLTVWEEQLRALAGQAPGTHDTFLGWLMNQILFIDQHFENGRPPEAFFTTLYIATLIVVVQAFVLYPPRMFRFRRRAGVAPAGVPQTPVAVAG